MHSFELSRSSGKNFSRGLTLFAAICLSCVSNLHADTAGERMFARLKGLTGEWEGTYQWSEGRTESGQLKATYYLSGNGSALVENLVMGGTPTMTTVYHLDGGDLRMTHYCAARNQPRLKASRIDEAAGEIAFSFVDVTNANPNGPGFVSAFEIKLAANDRLNLTFTFAGGIGKGPIENISLKRIGSAKT